MAHLLKEAGWKGDGMLLNLGTSLSFCPPPHSHYFFKKCLEIIDGEED